MTAQNGWGFIVYSVNISVVKKIKNTKKKCKKKKKYKKKKKLE